MKINLRVLPVLMTVATALAMVMSGIGCAVNNKVTLTGGAGGDPAVATASTIPATTRVWVLTPMVAYEDTLSEAPLDAHAYNGPAVVAALNSQTISILNGKGVHEVVGPDDASLSEGQRLLAQQAGTEANHLVRANPPLKALQYVQGLAATNGSVAVLAEYVRVKVGPNGTWDPNSGAITSGASSSYFRAALLDARTGRKLWENSVLLREVVKPDSSRFQTIVPLLFSTLNIQN
jgi:hypothetical protein